MNRVLLFSSVLTTDGTTNPDEGSMDGGADAGVDAGPPLECAFGPVMVGGTSETDAIADAPARCGQAEHR